MSIDPKQITPRLLIEECGPGAYERGSRYFRQGRTTLKSVSHPGTQRTRIQATTRGSGTRRYTQRIDISRFGNGIEIDGSCGCPVGYNCKHVVAACLAYMEEGQSDTEQSGAADFTDWLARLSSPATPSRSEGGAADALLYNLTPHSYGNGITVSFSVARRKMDGSFGKGRTITLAGIANQYQRPRYLQPVDEEIVALLRSSNNSGWSGATLNGAAGNTALRLMAGCGRAFWGEQREGPLRWGGERLLGLGWLEEGKRLRLQLSAGEGALILPATPPLYIDPGRHSVGPLALPEGLPEESLEALSTAPPIPRREAERISRLLALNHPQLPTPTEVAIRELTGLAPAPQLAIHFDGAEPLASKLEMKFRYGDALIDAGNDQSIVTLEQGEELVRIRRDSAAEAMAVARLQQEGLEYSPELPQRFTPQRLEGKRQEELAAWLRFCDEGVAELEKEGWEIAWSGGEALRLSRAEAIEAQVEGGGNDWFELRFDIEVEGERVPLLPLVSDLIGDYRPGTLPPTLYLPIAPGRYLALPAERIEPVLQTIIDLFDNLGGAGELRLSRLDAPRLLDLGEVKVRGGHELQRLAKKLQNFTGVKTAKLPTTFRGELRAYQQQGVNWLQFLREYGLAGILADDMGLGKTVQTLAHLAIEKRAGRMRVPSLIVAPTSLMGNWRREAAQFTPKLKVLVLHGPERADHFDTLHHYDLVLTTYPLLPRDSDVLLEQPWHYLILDEAQQIKNPKSQAAQLVRELTADHRLCLTGTPMENHLGELWAQFDFLLPGFLGDQHAFARHYRTPIEKEGDGERLKRLTQRTAPFMLRRTKELVARELPQKSELLRTVPVEGRQAALYESIRLTMEKRVREAIAKKGLARSHITILDALLKLRQVCCDPRLLPKGTRGSKGAHSAKLDMLMELLPEMLEEGRRILLFSQFTTMLGLIEAELQELAIPYTKLTGQTRRREEAIERFRSGEVDLFLISLKAGGVGLNLTEADTVIHYDPWWNPAVEAQATDRAHRIGQKKPVFVYKLITEGTVEEKILALQAKKQRLANSIYGKQQKDEGVTIDAESINALLAGV